MTLLIDNLVKGGWLKTPAIVSAFRKIRRDDFLPKGMEDLAELDEALPIGYGQTISQPLTVAFMLEVLEPQPGEKILDIGAGSGWTAALLGQITGEKGKVIAVERILELKNFGEANVSKYNFIKSNRVQFVLEDGALGYEKEAPFDKILASASAAALPQAWKEQLKIGGRIVSPIGSSIWVFIKESETEFKETEYPGFAFVPLISKR